MAEVSSILIGVLVISAIFIGMGNFYTDISESHPGVNQTENLAAFDQTSEISDKMGIMKDKLKSDEKGGPTDAPTELLTGAWATAKIMLLLPNMLTNVIVTPLTRLGIVPDWAMAMLTVVFMIIIFYALLSLIFRWNT